MTQGVKPRLACGVLIAVACGVAPTGNAFAAPLYEGVEVLGVMDCYLDGDIRIAVEQERSLRCDFNRRGAPGVLKRYVAQVFDVEKGAAVSRQDFLCWTVLRLERDNVPYTDEGKSFTGTHRSASHDEIEKYGLKEGALIGGGDVAFALEPRCDADRAGRNIAASVLRMEVRD